MPSIESQAGQLLDQLTIDEKLAQLYSMWCLFSEDGTIKVRSLNGFISEYRNANLESDLRHGLGHIVRPLGSQPISPRAGVEALNRIQEHLVKHTRMGIPALAHEECLAGLMARGATLFPSGINNGSLWDEDLVKKIAGAIAGELHSVGSRLGLSPVLDVARDARWGRLEESMGEDPYLTGSLAVAWVQGFQGPAGDLMATLKHYAGHSMPEGGRNHAPVRIGECELNDVMLLPFEMAVKLANAAAVMPAYHDLDGVPLHASKKYLNDLLREDWGFEGLIVSDYSGIEQLHREHRLAENRGEAAHLALLAGVDAEFPGSECYGEAAKNAIAKGSLHISLVDQSVKRILKTKLQLGLFKKPYTSLDSIELRSAATTELAYDAAVQSAVLLKNDGTLPLKDSRDIALIGPLADDKLCMFSGYSFPVHLILSGLADDDNDLTSIKAVLSEEYSGQVHYARGCDILTERPKESAVFPGDVSLDGKSQKNYISYDKSGFGGALSAADEADTIIVVLGDLAGLFLTGTVGEGSDTTSLTLPGVQQDLLNALLDTGKKVIVVLVSGRPYSLGESGKRCAAILQAWLPGMSGPKAITDILLGRRNPSGRLPVSVVAKAGVMPYFYNHKLKSAGTPIQPDFGSEYPFGFGLSYTDFSYSDWVIEQDEVDINTSIHGSVSVRNIGNMDGDVVLQLYVRDRFASRVRPVLELKGFKKLFLKAGEEADVAFELPVDMLNFTDRPFERIVEPGEFEIILGSDAENHVFQSVVTVTGSSRRLPKNWKMQSSFTIRNLRSTMGSSQEESHEKVPK
ncbi:glycoside hydrolase family 3 N-terminal domain-containing protein [Spirochaeta dissipatitropha]